MVDGNRSSLGEANLVTDDFSGLILHVHYVGYVVVVLEGCHKIIQIADVLINLGNGVLHSCYPVFQLVNAGFQFFGAARSKEGYCQCGDEITFHKALLLKWLIGV